MAAVFDSSNNFFSSATGPAANSPLTYCCFFYMTFSDGLQTILDLYDGSDGDQIALDRSNVLHLNGATSGSGVVNGPTVVTNKWYFVAGSLNGNDGRLYAKVLGGPCLSVYRSTGTWTQYAVQSVSFGAEANNLSNFGGTICSGRVWTGVLSQAELELESQSLSPVRTQGLWDWWMMENVNDVRGRTGRDTLMTVNSPGTMGFMGDPPIAPYAPNVLPGRLARVPSSGASAPPFGGCAYEC